MTLCPVCHGREKVATMCGMEPCARCEGTGAICSACGEPLPTSIQAQGGETCRECTNEGRSAVTGLTDAEFFARQAQAKPHVQTSQPDRLDLPWGESE